MIKEETVQRALQEIQKGFAQYEYFFSQLDSSAWLEPLARNGFFRKPLKPIRDGERISLPLWPESRYLVRMSTRPEAQQAIVQIVLGIPDTDNSRVHDDLAEIALALEPVHSAKLVPQASKWVESPFKLLLAEKIANLIVHLAKGHEGKAALTLARAALALGPDPTASQSSGEGEEKLFRRIEPQAHFDHFWYQRILLKTIPELTRAAGLDAVRLCFDLLNDAIAYSTKNSAENKDDDEDYIYIRHTAIEVGQSRDDIPDSLLCAARDAAEQLITRDHTQFSEVIGLAASKRWVTFRRLELHLCRLFPDEGQAFTERFFHTPEKLERPSLRHEAVLLLKTRFAALTQETQQRILEWMDQGPSEDAIQRWLQFVGQPVTTESIKAISNQRRRDFFAILEDQLPEPYRHKLDTLVAAAGAARRLEETDRIKGGAFSPQSPKSASELAQMTVDDVISFLETWKAGPGMFEATKEGMGRDLTAIVIRRPVEFATAASKFRNLDPTYIRSLFAGLTAALKNDAKFDWQPVLELAAWITNQPREIAGRTGDVFVQDPDWGWTRDAIIDLLTAGFEDRIGKLTLEYRPAVWQALKPLSEDPFPTLENETGPNFDPAFLSINSTRGRALNAVVQYAVWVQDCTNPKPADWRQHTFAQMPEVQSVLDARLDLKIEPTLTIRSVFGRCLQWLARLDWQWLQERLAIIFPLANEKALYFHAAWDSFLFAWKPSAALLPDLFPFYRAGIQHIGKEAGKMQRPANPDDLLSEHLIIFYWWGTLNLDGEDRLLSDFYSTASDKLRAHATWFVGRSVSEWDENVPDEPLARLKSLFEWRLKIASESASIDDFRQELMAFGWWIDAAKFGEEWKLETLLSVLQLTKKIANEMNVVKHLVEFSSKYPRDSVACLRLMVEGNTDRWLLVGVEKEAEDILTHALASPAARDSGLALIQELMARGHYGFRKVLITHQTNRTPRA